MEELHEQEEADNPNNENSNNFAGMQSDTESFMLETGDYVRQIKQRRGELMSRIDTNARDRLSRKVGYEIEKRLVRAKTKTMMRKKKQAEETRKKRSYNPFSKLTWQTMAKRRRRDSGGRSLYHYHGRRRSRKYRYHHRFCVKCVTSSFGALFQAVIRPMRFITDSNRTASPRAEQNHYDGNASQTNSESRAPTPKILLGKDGKLQWPVFQYGGTSGTGMLISTEGIFAAKKKSSGGDAKHQPGRENFSLGAQIDEDDTQTNTYNYNNNNNNQNDDEEDNSKKTTTHVRDTIDNEDRRLLGWLQVRDPKNNRKKQYIPVVNPQPEGPFRKAPWHGNMHVLKF